MAFRLYFSVEGLQEALEEVTSGAVLDIESFNVYECSSKDGTYQFLDNVDYDPTKDYIEVVPRDETYWFELAYVTSNKNPTTVNDELIGNNGINVSGALSKTPVRDQTLVIKDNGVVIEATADRDGKITGVGVVSGNIDYVTGVLSVELAAVPTEPITVDYVYWDTVEAVESDRSDPILGEEIDKVILAVRTAMDDMNVDNPAFTDDEFLGMIRLAIRRFKGNSQSINLSSDNMAAIILLVRISSCYVLAYDASKFTKLELPDGIVLNKGERVKHYLAVAKALEKHYENLMSDLGGSAKPEDLEDFVLAGTPSFEVVDATKKTYFNKLTRFSTNNYLR